MDARLVSVLGFVGCFDRWRCLSVVDDDDDEDDDEEELCRRRLRRSDESRLSRRRSSRRSGDERRFRRSADVGRRELRSSRALAFRTGDLERDKRR